MISHETPRGQNQSKRDEKEKISKVSWHFAFEDEQNLVFSVDQMVPAAKLQDSATNIELGLPDELGLNPEMKLLS